MVIDISELMWSIVLGIKNNNPIQWLEENVGPQIDEHPDFVPQMMGVHQELRYHGRQWAITFETLFIPNPVSEDDWGPKNGELWGMMPYSKTITTTRYFLHLLDASLAVMFKLLWL
jgi:hypothetical protein